MFLSYGLFGKMIGGMEGMELFSDISGDEYLLFSEIVGGEGIFQISSAHKSLNFNQIPTPGNGQLVTPRKISP